VRDARARRTLQASLMRRARQIAQSRHPPGECEPAADSVVAAADSVTQAKRTGSVVVKGLAEEGDDVDKALLQKTVEDLQKMLQKAEAGRNLVRALRQGARGAL
jgi:hypothetical protein